jgi:hypothetical protein
MTLKLYLHEESWLVPFMNLLACSSFLLCIAALKSLKRARAAFFRMKLF